MTTIRLNCGHVYDDAADDIELRDRIRCTECFDAGEIYARYVVAVQP